VLGIAVILGAASAAAQDAVTFLDQERRIGPRLEWSREVVARKAGSIRCRVESQAPFAVTLVADRTYQAMLRRDHAGLRREDVLFSADSAGASVDREYAIPAPGSFWFVMANQSDGEVTMRVSCLAPGAR
jgi:hypothetical protein